MVVGSAGRTSPVAPVAAGPAPDAVTVTQARLSLLEAFGHRRTSKVLLAHDVIKQFVSLGNGRLETGRT